MFIQIGNKSYELVQDNRNGWNPEAFKQRYSEVLDRYDYIVGDWGYNQLRLKGFYRDNHPKATRDTAISSMADYINEYCNFGCAYFVLQKAKDLPKDKETLVGGRPDKDEEAGAPGAAPKDQPLREHLSSREHHAKMKQAKEASKAAAREAREAKEAEQRLSRERLAQTSGKDGQTNQ
ncbi:YutD family protein [Paenibacillus caui]|uniref:YutD family protein n=1 Tax=Paenibacillus caui TaxID=2873927 RepID=UPI0030801C9D